MKHNSIIAYYAQYVDSVCKITDSYLYYEGRLDDAIRVAENSLQIADNDEIDHSDLIRLLIQLAKLLNRRSFFGIPQFEKNVKILARAQRLATEIEDQKLLANTLIYLGEAYDYQTTYKEDGDYQEALNYFEQALTIFQSIESIEGEGRATFNLGLIHQRKQDLEKAKSCFEKAYQIAVQEGYLFDQSLAIRHLGQLHFSVGDYDLAEECAKESLKLRKELGYRLYLPPAHHILGIVYIIQENWEHAFTHLDKAYNLANEMKLPVYAILIQLALGEWYKRQGNKENAQLQFQEAYDKAVAIGHQRWQKVARADLKTLQDN